MDERITPLERAFELAKSGTLSSVPDIKRQPKAEGHSTDQITGGVLTRQLNALIKAAARENE
jgi:hypothetical protein